MFNSELTTHHPQIFKGIALFTPGGDLIYCIDPHKQGRWHLNLCTGLQEIFELSEPPHFLVPAYTATVDTWLDPYTQQIKTFAEVYPPIKRHIALLTAVFQTNNLTWELLPIPEELSDPILLDTYRQQFPELWENHDLIVRLENNNLLPKFSPISNQGYVLRLFVSGRNSTTTNTLKSLHNLLEKSLHHPYTLKVIDVFKHPETAEANHISATPTLVRVWPLPVRRIVGNLDDADKVLHLLNISDD